MADNLWHANRMTVRVLSPIHIGAGDKLDNLAFVRSGSELIVLDSDKLLVWISADAQRADRFVGIAERMARAATLPNRSEGRQQRRAIAKEFAALIGNAHLDELTAYRVRTATGATIDEVMAFIKTGAYRPYLPGSSVKGTVRSQLLRGLLNVQPQRAAELAALIEPQVQKGDRRASEDLQAAVFVPAESEKEAFKAGQRSNYDLNRTLAFTDSDLKTTQNLEVVEVKVFSTQFDDTLDSKPYSIFVETARPGTEFTLTLTQS